MRVHLASDHAGYQLKTRLVEHLGAAGHDVTDHGAHTYDEADDYPPFCFAAGEAVAADPESLGIVIGGSGNGEQIAANKVRGVRSALVWSEETASLARRHNDANVMSIGARMHDIAEAIELAETFLGMPYSAERRHQNRIDMLAAYEAER